MEIKVKSIQSSNPVPDAKIKCGSTLIVSKNDKMFGPFLSYRLDPANKKEIRTLISLLTQIIEENAES